MSLPALSRKLDMIPVLACPVLNRADLFLRMIRSIDYPVEKLVVINNGDDPGIAAAIEQLTMEGEVALEVTHPVCNIGVAASWNFVMRNYPDALYWLFIGNDIQLTKGDLKKMDHFIRSHTEYATVPANWGHSLFAVTKVGLDVVGYFDENFYPAYCEDQDWMYRLKLAGVDWADCPDVHAVHGEPPLWGSSTVWSDPKLTAKCAITQKNNHMFYEQKWGGPPGKEVFITPFNDPSLTLKDCPYNEDIAEANQNPVFQLLQGIQS
jgi:hypothetical protein